MDGRGPRRFPRSRHDDPSSATSRTNTFLTHGALHQATHARYGFARLRSMAGRATPSPRPIVFGPFALDRARGHLRHGDTVVPLRRKAWALGARAASVR